MKKTFMIMVVICTVAVLGVSSAFAGTWDADGEVQMGANTTIILGMSKNVQAVYGYSTSGTIADSYSLCTFHSSGDRTIGSGSVDQKIYWFDSSDGVKESTQCTADPTAGTSNFDGETGWSGL